MQIFQYYPVRIIFVFSLFLIILSLIVPFYKSLADDFGLEHAQNIQAIAKKGTLADFVARIIKWVIGLLGVILVGLMVYAGVLYMTAAGKEEQVKTAKTVLTYAIIGIAIIAPAYIIATYIIMPLAGVNEIPGQYFTLTNKALSFSCTKYEGESCSRDSNCCIGTCKGNFLFFPTGRCTKSPTCTKYLDQDCTSDDDCCEGQCSSLGHCKLP